MFLLVACILVVAVVFLLLKFALQSEMRQRHVT